MDNNNGKHSGYFSKKLRAGKRRTYFFDVRSTKQDDYFLTITESKKKFEGDGYESHKIFLYKEDFKKFVEALNETVDYIKTDLMPDYDYDSERPARTSGHGEFSEYQSAEKQNTKTSKTEQSGSTQQVKTETESGQEKFESGSTPPIGDDEEMDWN